MFIWEIRRRRELLNFFVHVEGQLSRLIICDDKVEREEERERDRERILR